MKGVGDKLDLGFEVKVVRHAGAAPELVRLADLMTGPTVISVYMRNNTGSCDRQVASLVEHAAAIRERGYGLMALSRDTAGSHGRYAAKQAIDFPLVSDPQDQFATAADAMVEKKMYGRTFQGPLRSAWVLDRAGRVVGLIDSVTAADHGPQVLALLASLAD